MARPADESGDRLECLHLARHDTVIAFAPAHRYADYPLAVGTDADSSARNPTTIAIKSPICAKADKNTPAGSVAKAAITAASRAVKGRIPKTALKAAVPSK